MESRDAEADQFFRHVRFTCEACGSASGVKYPPIPPGLLFTCEHCAAPNALSLFQIWRSQIPVDCCACFDQYTRFPSSSPKNVAFHGELQDTSSTGWKRLRELIDEAAGDGREMFEPLSALSWEERIQVVTLPSTIGRLTAVKKLVLEASNLVRLPAAIGAMTCLEDLDLYQSYRLHWVPYEITRCPLRSSRVSTRALYGNPTVNAPFPRLEAATTDAKAGLHLGALDPPASELEACSVCGAPLSKTELRQVWVTMHVATDMLPLLVNACSESCIRMLPRPSHQDFP